MPRIIYFQNAARKVFFNAVLSIVSQNCCVIFFPLQEPLKEKISTLDCQSRAKPTAFIFHFYVIRALYSFFRY